MPTSTKPAIRIAVAAAALAALGLAAPQASAAGAGAPAADVVSSRADSETREIAAEDPGAVQAMATPCGRGYQLIDADRLPSAQRRLGTLFRYGKSGGDGWRGCALFDNNTGGTKYMKLTVCGAKNGERRCDKDSGDFSQYAGPVYTGPNRSDPKGAKVTAIMKKKWNSDTRLIDAERCAGACN